MYGKNVSSRSRRGVAIALVALVVMTLATPVLLPSNALAACTPASPNIDGDLDNLVNLVDVGLFAQDFFSGEYVPRSNLYCDTVDPQVLDLKDIAVLAEALGS